MSNQQTVTLNNGKQIPLLGFGTWQSKPNEVRDAVYTALETGYKHIDCAAVYGNETEVGEAFNKFINVEKKIKREELFVTSKLWNSHHSKEHVREACKKTLKDLQLEYLDLYLIHWPVAFEFNGLDLTKEGAAWKNSDPNDKSSPVNLAKVPFRETWEEMEALVNDGLVKSIGISNFSASVVIDMMTYAKIKPVVNQVECHPYLDQNKLRQNLEWLGDIKVEAYSPLGSAKKGGPMEDELIKELGKKYNKSPANILLRWNIQRGIIVLPKSVTASRIKSNFEVYDFELTNEEMEKINKLHSNKRFIDPSGAWGYDVFA